MNRGLIRTIRSQANYTSYHVKFVSDHFVSKSYHAPGHASIAAKLAPTGVPVGYPGGAQSTRAALLIRGDYFISYKVNPPVLVFWCQPSPVHIYHFPFKGCCLGPIIGAIREKTISNRKVFHALTHFLEAE